MSVERIFLAGRPVRIQARIRCCRRPALACGAVSGRVHSRYERRLVYTAAAGQEVMICLPIRRFFCPGAACKKTTFAEQVPGLTVRYGRRSAGLTRALQAIALALGGRAGARLSARLAAGMSQTRLIRLIRALPEPALARAVRVLGVDEFALRRGHCLRDAAGQMSRPAGRWTSWRSGRLTRSPPGWPRVPARRSSAGTRLAAIPTAGPRSPGHDPGRRPLAVRHEAPGCIPGSAGRNRREVLGSAGLPGSESEGDHSMPGKRRTP